MAMCDECGCFDDNWLDGEDITEEELEDDPLYEPHRYYYWHGDIQEDYQMPKGYDCLCESCFGTFLTVTLPLDFLFRVCYIKAYLTKTIFIWKFLPPVVILL